MKAFRLCPFFLFFLATACSEKKPEVSLIDPLVFAGEADGKKVELFTLRNNSGMVAQITNYGGRVVSLWVPDRNGIPGDVVLGYDTFEAYLKSNELYFGTLIGRYGNRIANARFTLNDSVYILAANNGINHLHGGIKGFHNVVWDAVQSDAGTLKLSYFSPDGEEGYPGNLRVDVTYEVTEKNELKIEYRATTDKPTPVNLTHHSFFNLKGAGEGDINDHTMQIYASHYTPVDSVLIPTGEIEPVAGTPFDFRTPVAIGDRIGDDHQQVRFGMGYDHNWILDTSPDTPHLAARVVEPGTGRIMEVFTSEPGIQFYGGNFITGKDTGKYNRVYPYRGALCLETQHFPDSPNQPQFPSTILEPGKEYHSICIYRFSAE